MRRIRLRVWEWSILALAQGLQLLWLADLNWWPNLKVQSLNLLSHGSSLSNQYHWLESELHIKWKKKIECKCLLVFGIMIAWPLTFHLHDANLGGGGGERMEGACACTDAEQGDQNFKSNGDLWGVYWSGAQRQVEDIDEWVTGC